MGLKVYLCAWLDCFPETVCCSEICVLHMHRCHNCSEKVHVLMRHVTAFLTCVTECLTVISRQQILMHVVLQIHICSHMSDTGFAELG